MKRKGNPDELKQIMHIGSKLHSSLSQQFVTLVMSMLS